MSICLCESLSVSQSVLVSVYLSLSLSLSLTQLLKPYQLLVLVFALNCKVHNIFFQFKFSIFIWILGIQFFIIKFPLTPPAIVLYVNHVVKMSAVVYGCEQHNIMIIIVVNELHSFNVGCNLRIESNVSFLCIHYFPGLHHGFLLTVITVYKNSLCQLYVCM